MSLILMKTAEQSKRQLNQIAFDPQLTPGARNAVRVCLRVEASEKATVITDEVNLEIAAGEVVERPSSVVKEKSGAKGSRPRMGLAMMRRAASASLGVLSVAAR